jgi:transposase
MRPDFEPAVIAENICDNVVMSDILKIKKAIINHCIDGNITNAEAAEKLGVSARQIIRMKQKVSEGLSLEHGGVGRIAVNSVSEEMKQEILKLRNRPVWEDMNFTVFHEHMVEEGYSVSYSSIARILKSNDIKSPRKHKSRIPHPRRVPRERAGELLQTDATPYPWFYNDPTNYALHGFIDDATGNVTGLHMCKNECMHGYIESFKQTIKNFGIPLMIYTDGLSLFKSKKEQKLDIAEQLLGISPNKTQFSRMLDAFKVGIMVAKSSQAKGKIERLWNSLHDRLRTELGVLNITSIEEANKYLPMFIKKYNEQFAKKPVNSTTAFMKLPPGTDLDKAFAVRYNRKIDGGNCFSFNGTRFKVEGISVLTGRTIDILISVKLGIKVEILDKLYKVTPIETNGKAILQDSDSIQAIVDRFIYENMLKNEKDASE